LNRADCCHKRLDGAKIFVGEKLCGTVSNPEAGGWVSVACKEKGASIKIQAAPMKYLHFCGLKIFAYSGTEAIGEEIAP
jgi:hypothetical protein